MKMDTSRAHLIPHNCYIKMQAVYPTLKTAEKRAADALLDDPDVVVKNTITEASGISKCSEATWFRLAKKLGYNGYLEMRADFGGHLDACRQSPEPAQIYADIGRDSTPIQAAEKVFESSINALGDTIRLLDESAYNHAVEALCGAERIMFCGVGDAHTVVRSAYQKFFFAGVRVFENPDADLQYIAISQMTPRDVVVAISYSGKTRSVVGLVKYARSQGVTVLSVTNFPNTPLTKNSDIVLMTAAFEKNTGGDIVSKRITQLALVESLYVNYLLRSGRDNNEYILKSGGAVKKNKL
jgi:DNA-binding MurR/RpiR family transcriptional regulator